MSSNLLDISTKNYTSKSSNPAKNKNEELFKNINQLKDQVKTKTIEIFSTITTRIWDSGHNDGLCKIQNQVCQQILDFDDAIDIAQATNEGIMK